MTKKLKKRIREACGLDSLNKEECALRVREILASIDEKQAICNQLNGISFKDIEKALSTSTKVSDDETLARDIPDKVYPERMQDNKSTSISLGLEPIMNKNEVAWLVEQSSKPLDAVIESISTAPTSYETYTREESLALVEGDYYPNKFKRKKGNS